MRTGAKIVLSVALAIAAGSSAGCSRSLDLSRSSTQMDFGVRMARENLWREALFRFERAVQIDPENAQALNNLAVAYEGIGEFEKAREAYARALRIDKSNLHIQKNYSRFVEFYSRNRKREQQLQSVTRAEQEGETRPGAEPEEREGPVELSQPEEPPRPGEIPVSDVPPNPAPPIPPQPPPGGSQ